MPMNHGQSQQSTRWYKLCFMPPSDDSSDDSDTESVVIAPSTSTQTSTWQEPSPPHSPLHPEPDINWLTLPPPPPPPFFTPLSPPQRSSQMPSLSPPPNPELQLNWERYFPPAPPPLSLLRQLEDANSEPRINMQSLQPPPPPPLPPLPQDSRDTVYRFTDNVSPSLIEQVRPGVNQSEFLRIPDSVINAIHMVTISELHERDELSQCPICMEEFKLGDQACQLPCNHRYKFECILRWLHNNTTCPVCRLQLEGFTGKGCSYNINDDGDSDDGGDNDSLDLEAQIPPQVNISLEDLFQFSPHSQVTVDGADHNSDEGDYDSACDDLDDAHEDGE
ncbi:unnamed protein product [Lathyrus oleraceus]|uniref:RING-type E3 ubiquitin transferase n=1 Tax=Pisum sativum TaxID=3888 RepID=A0A9D4YBP7_PEA|nr:E3 ubiquitin-protein ligase RING1-like [Pisum sativum]KAI5436002.1 hypothetical protein KIW84_022436 [Pisum sativum]